MVPGHCPACGPVRLGSNLAVEAVLNLTLPLLVAEIVLTDCSDSENPFVVVSKREQRMSPLLHTLDHYRQPTPDMQVGLKRPEATWKKGWAWASDPGRAGSKLLAWLLTYSLSPGKLPALRSLYFSIDSRYLLCQVVEILYVKCWFTDDT